MRGIAARIFRRAALGRSIDQPAHARRRRRLLGLVRRIVVAFVRPLHARSPRRGCGLRHDGVNADRGPAYGRCFSHSATSLPRQASILRNAKVRNAGLP